MPEVLLPLIAFFALQALDAWTTVRILSGGGRELNPVLAALFRRLGVIRGLAIVKLALLGIALAASGVLPGWAWWALDAGYLLVVINNLLALRRTRRA